MAKIVAQATAIVDRVLRDDNLNATQASAAYAAMLTLNNRATQEDEIAATADGLNTLARIVASFEIDPDDIAAA